MSFFKVGDDAEPLVSRARLHIMVLLSTVPEADFIGIRDVIGLSDGQLSQHLAKLSDLGLVDLKRSLVGKKSRTVVKLTPDGASLLTKYMEDMRKVLGQVPDDLAK